MKKVHNLLYILVAVVLFSACSTTRSKKEVKGFKKFYHNTTAKFNGYFNAEELMKESMASLQEMNVDNYNNILSVYDYVDIDNPQTVKEDMDKAIEKLSTVATIHDVSNYVDDCYMLIGKAQYLKQDYIAAEETFLYFEEVFDPRNPYGKAYDSRSKKKSKGRKSKKEIKDERKEKEAERKIKQEEKEKERKAKEDLRKEKEKERKEEAKQRKKDSKKRKKGKSRKKRSDRDKDKSATTAKKTEKKVETKPVELTPEQKALQAKKEAEAKLSEEEAKRRKKLEEEKKKKRDKEEEKYKNQGEGAIFKNKTAYTEGLYWLARTYIETRSYTAADFAFKRLENTPGLSQEIENRIPAAKAHLYLRTKELDRALLELESAIELEGNRNKRARYAFIRAQIYEEKDDADQAYEEYRRARKFSTSYELDFNANLNELKLSYRKGKTSQKKALAKLQNYLDDHKNQDYNDQIYFTRAQVKLDGGDLIGAKDDFEQAISSSGGNKNVKLEAYYKLADLLFDGGYYSEAKDNYDNALKLMNKSDARYKQLERLSNSLTDIALHINTVVLQDSLLRLSKLTEMELREMAVEMIEERRANQPDEPKTNNPNQRKSNIITSNRQLGAGRSSFFAYNPVALNQGKVEFKRIYGDRILEDNWRRSLRPDAILSPLDIVTEEEEDVVEEVSETEIRELLRDVPRNESQLAASNLRIQKALFQLGVLFRERLRNYKKAIEVLDRLVVEYPQYERRDEALFYLYLSYLDVEKGKEALAAKNQLVKDYPDSKFTKLATDPSYAESLKNNEDSIEKYYETTFALFEKGEYDEVMTRISKKDEIYKKNKTYAAKFSLLNAMSLGSVKGKTDYIQALEQLIRSHPKSPEEARAKEILRFLKGDQDAFNDILFDEATQTFESEPDKLHYVFIVTYGLNQKAFDKAKLDVLNYNKKFHRFDNLKLSNIYLSEKNEARIILIRSFDNKEKSMKYYEGVEKNKNLFIQGDNIGYDIFPATQKNYREVIKQRSVSNYRAFFEQSYKTQN
ncbi:MAG: tetratricopeptide repeat protein [Bacteroidia bacterium]|nr:tetratricopeptide repeat protein [Bacteroidia bacterium]